jgi:hypothetical protein
MSDGAGDVMPNHMIWVSYGPAKEATGLNCIAGLQKAILVISGTYDYYAFDLFCAKPTLAWQYSPQRLCKASSPHSRPISLIEPGGG